MRQAPVRLKTDLFADGLEGAFRDTLLSKLISGELWVKEAEGIAEATA
ncbi:MAG: hypothetical protein ACYCQK_03005 [Acidiferrobacteraceae bacterium]